jgi:hypothetical protein
MASARQPLTDAQRQQFAALILLDRLVALPGAFHAGLMDEKDDVFLEQTFAFLQQEDLAEVGEDDRFRLTERGRRAYRGMIARRQSYLAHFEIFGRVDLAEGTFADPADAHDHPRWSDLRVAVAEYKGIDPYRIVFLALLADEAFFESRDWKFDLALGSSFFRELEEIVDTQITADELAYETEDGEQISGDAVLEDVILQGAGHNRAHWEHERGIQQNLLPEPESGGEDEAPAPAYDPFGQMAFYEQSAQYVEPIWLHDLW